MGRSTLVSGNNVWNSPGHGTTKWGGLLWSREILYGIHQDMDISLGILLHNIIEYLSALPKKKFKTWRTGTPQGEVGQLMR